MSLLPIAGGTLNLSGTISAEDISAVVVNITTGNISEYANFVFNSFAKIGGKVYGCQNTCVCLLEGDDDKGQDIDSAFLTGITDFPNEGQYGAPDDDAVDKCLTDGYIDSEVFEEVGALRLRIDKSKDRLYFYAGTSIPDQGPKNHRFKLAKGLKGRHWQVGYENIDGSNFKIHSIFLKGARLKRRV